MKISAGTIARTVILVLALINQILTALGKSPLPFEDETVTQIVSLLFTAVSSAVAWWKNNSFTKAAIQADAVMKELKASDD